MRFKKLGLILLAAASFLFSYSARADLWCTAYYPGYEQAGMPASAIDFDAVTHIVHFSVFPPATTNGPVNADSNVLTHEGITNVLTLAHQAGKKVLVCVGGQGSDFSQVTNINYLTNFITGLTNFMHTNGYDGIDLDWEPVESSDQQGFTNLVVRLRAAMDAFNPRPLLTIAMPDTLPHSLGPSILGLVKDKFDQINIQTYDLSGAYEGWFTWFNSPIYDGGASFPNNGGVPPSIDNIINLYLTNGFTASKLGIGIPFEGYVWNGGTTTSNANGVSIPRQTWNIAPTFTSGHPYKDLTNTYSTNLYHWDTNAQAAYYSVTNQGANNQFVPFDDARAVQSKISYARNKGLGGVILFELADDHTTGPDPLLQAVKQALATPGPITIQRNGQASVLSFTNAPLGSYRIQYATNVVSPAWNSLLVTNETGAGGARQVADPIAPGQPRRFYRVQTPP